MVFPFTHLFQKNTLITIRLTNNDANGTMTASVALVGQALYHPESPGGLSHLNADGLARPTRQTAPLMGMLRR